MRLQGLPTLLTAAYLIAGCSDAVREHFAKSGYTDPRHIERLRGVPLMFGIDGRCVDAPQHREFFERAVAGISEEDLVGKEVCSRAEATTLTSPFVQLVESTDGRVSRREPRLAMVMNSYGKEFIKDDVTFAEARGGIDRTRAVAVERGVDSWQVDFLQDSIGRMWNVALFIVNEGFVTFDCFVYHFEPLDVHMVVDTDYVPPEQVICARHAPASATATPYSC